MKRVKVSELKAHFSAYLRRAQKGERVTVLDRDQPIAELGPIPIASDDAFSKLVESGHVLAGGQDFSDIVLPRLGIVVDVQALLDAVRADR